MDYEIIVININAIPPKKPIFFNTILAENTYIAIDASSKINATNAYTAHVLECWLPVIFPKKFDKKV